MDVKSITLSSLMVALICLAAATGIVLLWSFKWSCSPLSQIPFSDGVSLYLIKGWFEKGILHGNRQYRINERWFCRRFSGNGNSTGGNSRRQKDNQEVQILLRGLQGSCLLLLPGPWYLGGLQCCPAKWRVQISNIKFGIGRAGHVRSRALAMPASLWPHPPTQSCSRDLTKRHISAIQTL